MSLFEKINHVLDDVEIIAQPTFSLTALAFYCQAHPTTISQTIHRETGLGFSTLLAQARVRYATKWLCDPQKNRLTIEAIGQELGFHSSSYFANTFRRVTGVNPSEWRRQCLVS